MSTEHTACVRWVTHAQLDLTRIASALVMNLSVEISTSRGSPLSKSKCTEVLTALPNSIEGNGNSTNAGGRSSLRSCDRNAKHQEVRGKMKGAIRRMVSHGAPESALLLPQENEGASHGRRSQRTAHSLHSRITGRWKSLRVNQPSWTVLGRTRNTICSRFCI